MLALGLFFTEGGDMLCFVYAQYFRKNVNCIQLTQTPNTSSYNQVQEYVSLNRQDLPYISKLSGESIGCPLFIPSKKIS